MSSPQILIGPPENAVLISFSMLEAYHGHDALAMLAVMFQGLRGALPLLPDGLINARNDVTVESGHPGPGVRDAFEFVTRSLTRGVYTVSRSRPVARFCLGIDVSYSFALKREAYQVQATLKEDALPKRFFTLIGRGQQRSQIENTELTTLKREIADDVLAQTPDNLFVFSH